MNHPGIASSVILVRPSGFGYDPQTADSNGFQQMRCDPDVLRLAGEEFDGLLDALRRCGIGICVLDPVDPTAPNAVFPNNWISTHADGTIVLYPMYTPSRRVERDPAVHECLEMEGFRIDEVRDISLWEQQGLILEGTGSMVLDRTNKVAYACLSPRTSASALWAWCKAMGHDPMPFHATVDGSPDGRPVYHTNVVMTIGRAFAVVCLEAIPDRHERSALEHGLVIAGKEVLPISIEQMHQFVGNMLELRALHPVPVGSGLAPFGVQDFIFLSDSAYKALRPDQRLALERFGSLVPVPIPTIEAVGGGSIRCMLTENFLTRRVGE